MSNKPCTVTGHGVPKQLPGRGPNGRRFCRWCHQEVPQGRRSYCNDECRKHADFNLTRHFAMQRDGHKCVLCGAGRHTYQEMEAARLEGRVLLRSAVEVDHNVAVADGGSHHPDNLRTLCCGCHRKRTAEQAAERARKRRLEKGGAA